MRHLLDWAEGHQRIREGYAIGTGRWRALPFALNVLTHSRQRYRRNLRFYADEPRLRVGGPTWHWVREDTCRGSRFWRVGDDDADTRFRLKKSVWWITACMTVFNELRAAAGHPFEE